MKGLIVTVQDVQLFDQGLSLASVLMLRMKYVRIK